MGDDRLTPDYLSLLERIPDAIWNCDSNGRLTFLTRGAGFSDQQLTGNSLDDRVADVHPDDVSLIREAMQQIMAGGSHFDVEYRRRGPDGRWIWVRNRSFARVERDGVVHVQGLLSNVTERRQLEDCMRSAQKMEAIAQLTGGIAHDFNNILSAILLNGTFLVDSLVTDDPRRADAEEIVHSAQRAAALTRQLLAFSRRQVLEPTTASLVKVVDGLEKMLYRLIGEDIDLTIVHGPDPGTVRADVGQLEQVIMNLVVNARDAMPGGGKLTIETANVDFDDAYSIGHGGVEPGPYVMLAVSDSGCGMDSETQRRIFEPFFTTKELGRGTGLGLSTCYGIIKQSGGWIWVYSEPGRGTVFKVYLPRCGAQAERAGRPAAEVGRRGNETVLLVEDDSRVRAAVRRMLEQLGYTVLPASDGLEATTMLENHRGPVHLVLSDVIMPGPNGPELLSRLERRRPSIKTLLMSGYTDHALLRDGALGRTRNFIQKPFSVDALARRLRELLDA